MEAGPIDSGYRVQGIGYRVKSHEPLENRWWPLPSTWNRYGKQCGGICLDPAEGFADDPVRGVGGVGCSRPTLRGQLHTVSGGGRDIFPWTALHSAGNTERRPVAGASLRRDLL